MNCYKHPDREAVAFCGDCYRGLCSECAAKYVVPVCDSCVEDARKRRRKVVRDHFLWFVPGVVLFLALSIYCLFYYNNPNMGFLFWCPVIFVPFVIPAFRIVRTPGCILTFLKLFFFFAFFYLGYPLMLVHTFLDIKKYGDGVIWGSGWKPALRFLLKNICVIVVVFLLCIAADALLYSSSVH